MIRKSKARNPSPSRSAKNALWGGRFEGGPAEIMARINASIDFDKRLAAQDIAGSRAHCSMLAARGIISKSDARAILKGLDRVEADIASGRMNWDRRLEDIHMHVESRLADIIGAPAKRLHTARSRNDQVATDFKLFVRSAIDRVDADVLDLMRALLTQAERHVATVMPGFTHLQAAQPVTFGHHLHAYLEMLGRDRGRLADCRRRLNESPLGAAALAGTPYPIDRDMTARALGFDRPAANSMDAVSDRDFAVEFLAAAAIIAMHLSRLAEEFVIWSSAQFRFVRLSDSFTTGSSIMPQKRNPDAAELVRGKTGRVYGALQAVLVMLKGLPLTYSKDMQEDKEPVFDTVDALALVLPAMAGMVGDMQVNASAMAAAAGSGYSVATDLADWLVRRAGLPFREAHHVVGKVVAVAEKKGVGLEGLTAGELAAIDSRLKPEARSVLSVGASVASRMSLGGTAPARVRAALRVWRKKIK